MKKLLFGLLLILLLLFIASDLFISFSDRMSEEELEKTEPQNRTIEALLSGTTTISVEIADEPDEQKKGLGGREDLAEDEGMLFLFGEAGRHGIWMKDMNFAIDIIWLKKGFGPRGELLGLEVVDLKTKVRPETFPMTFYPSSLSDSVLEIASGRAEELQIDVGDILKIK